jgi:hypothetical protein
VKCIKVKEALASLPDDFEPTEEQLAAIKAECEDEAFWARQW